MADLGRVRAAIADVPGMAEKLGRLQDLTTLTELVERAYAAGHIDDDEAALYAKDIMAGFRDLNAIACRR
ncbi:MAG: hypothetical protein M3O87_06300 [Candidatus Dormibacteraeota bacterium]|nr:hypothetical protein [Candidatus Dormibacteraeota bacterium]